MKNYLLSAIVCMAIISCESDDDSATPVNSNTPNDTEEVIEVVTETEVEEVIEVEIETEIVASKIIRVSMVNPSANQVTFRNFGNVETNIGDYWLCLGPGTYRQISTATDSSTILAPNAELTVNYNMSEVEGGLSIFTTNSFGSSDPEILIDYVQWGDGNQQRADQAVTAGRWNNADSFIPNATTYTFNGEEAQFGEAFWTGTTELAAVASKIIRVSMVNPSANQVTFRNFGNVETNIGDYWLCLGPGTYRRISSGTNDSTVLAPNAELTVNYNMNEASGGLSIFTTNSFGSSDPEILIDYVQWGARNQQRADQAVTAGRWNNADSFIPSASTYTFNGEEAQFGDAFWTGN